MSDSQLTLDDLCINTLRTLAMDAVQKANSGHPGAPMGLAPAAYVLWTKHLAHNPKNSAWPDRDRFVLSGGHGSALLYSLLHLTGYGLSLDDLKSFRQWESKTPGHPEYGHTNGVEVTTGPLGQGIANAVGMAMAERHLAATYNTDEHTIVDHRTYVMCGDGDLMEGVALEAISMAGHMGLGKLTCLYDDNQITIEGGTDIAFTEDVAARFAACGWNTIRVEDGNNHEAIDAALTEARSQDEKPTVILMRTTIAYGSPNKGGTSGAHGAPLGEEEILLTKKALGWPSTEPFFVPEEAKAVFSACMEKGEEAESQWQERFNAYAKAHPKRTNQWVDGVSGFLTFGWDKEIPTFTPEDGKIATRSASGKVLNAIAPNLPGLVGGSADLAPSNNTFMNDCGEFQKGAYEGRNIRFGVREHAMGAVMNGMFVHGGVRPFGGTFLVFADYMRPAIRVASLMKLPIIYVFTHDSIAVGEDGPTHQPVEHVAALRAIPGLTVLRPGCASETADAWRVALKITDGPTALILSRQGLPVSDRSQSEGSVPSGAYILKDSEGTPDAILMASGSEVHITVEAAEKLAEKGVKARVVSMPSWELFDMNPQNYKDWVLTPEVKTRVAVEAGIAMGWEKYVGDKGTVISMEGFGASAPGGTLLKEFGFSADNIVEKTLALIEKNKA
ncbi:transketolase [Desulfoluna butyratoxydans]|uniref:Transketolase n=1 Tax=Desulfoluna butyratoxydans TaxID=231438 RepID=A0A4V6IL74_9BACT|nr:transketolase [Desulfoluna butyratoxydans]VFQ44078.1 transketolase bacterial-like [Desulfoluna butyratoxydans]